MNCATTVLPANKSTHGPGVMSVVSGVAPLQQDEQARIALAELEKTLKPGLPGYWRAAWAIQAFDEGRVAIPLLTEFIEDSGPFRGGPSAYLLAMMGPSAESAVPSLLRTLEKTEDRYEVLYALAAIGPKAKATAPALKRLLRTDNMRDRPRVAYVLWRVSGEKEPALTVFESVLKQSLPVHGEFTTCALQWLGEMGSTAKGQDKLVKQFVNHAEPEVRQAATFALAKIARDEQAIQQIRTWLADDTEKNQALRIKAIQESLEMKKLRKEVNKSADDLLENDAEARKLLMSWIPLLPRTKDEQVKLLLPYLRSRIPVVRQEAVYYLGGMRSDAKAALPELRQMREDKDQFVRWQVAGAIRLIEAKK